MAGEALDARTRYALLAALDLAANYANEKPVKVRQIAARTGVPPNYLVHILLQLKRRALVNSTRGRNGGYWLLRPPELISAAEVTAAVGSARAPAPRASDRSPYDGAIEGLWGELRRQRHELLAQTTLADLLKAGG